MIAAIRDFVSVNLTKILAGALAVSLLGNVGLGIATNHYAGKAASCKTSVVAVNKAAEEKKQIVEKRQEKNIVKTQDRARKRIEDANTRIANATRSLRSQGGQSHRPSSGTGPGSPAGEGGTPVVLPSGDGVSRAVLVDADTYANDQRICVTNTIKAEEWQLFYGQQVEIWEEENVGRQ